MNDQDALTSRAVRSTGLPLRRLLISLVLAIIIPMAIGVGVAIRYYSHAEHRLLQQIVEDRTHHSLVEVDRLIAKEVGTLSASAEVLSVTTPFPRIPAGVRDALSRQGVTIVRSPDVADQHFVIGPFRPLPRTRSLAAAIDVPVVRDGRSVFMLRKYLSSATISESLAGNSFARGLYISLQDSTGRTVAESERHALSFGYALSRRPSGVSPDAGQDLMRKELRSGYSGLTVATVVRENVLLAPLDTAVRGLALITALLTLTALAALYIVARTLELAHLKLANTARSLGSGGIVEGPRTPLREANLLGATLADASRRLTHQADELRDARDQLELRVAERTAEVRRGAAMLETIVESIDQGIALIGPEGEVLMHNRRARTVLSYLHGGIDPCSSEILELSEDGRSLLPVPPRMLTEANGFPDFGFVRKTYSAANGTVFDVVTMAMPRGGWVRTWSDQTVRHRAQQDLQHAKDEAEQANDAKDVFLATVTHEMRTPLNSVIGYTELLLADAQMSDKQRTMAGTIRDAAESLLAVVNDLLDIAKIEAGVLELHPRPFAIQELVNEVTATFTLPAAAKGLLLEQGVTPGVPEFLIGDRQRVRQILTNLLDNAVKFTTTGCVNLQVDTTSSGYVRLSVTDDGIGFPTIEQRRFQQFQQLDPSHQRRYGGSGLGLAICQDLVERMGGELCVESRPEGGTTAWVILPLGISKSPAKTEETSIGLAPSPRRILIVDDEEPNRALVGQMLADTAWSVDSAENGAAAVEAAGCILYDLILMDIRMPVLDGIAAIRQIRAMSAPHGLTPIVACSAHLSRDQQHRLHALDVDVHLVKPIRTKDLLSVVGAMTSSSKSGSEDAAALSDVPKSFAELTERCMPGEAVRTLREQLVLLEGTATPANCRQIVHAMIPTSRLMDAGPLLRMCVEADEVASDDALLAMVERIKEESRRLLYAASAAGRDRRL